MIKTVVAAIAALHLLAACSGKPDLVVEAEQAERRAEMVRANGGSKSEQCDALREVERAWLAALERERHRTAKLYADASCSSAATEALL